MSSKRFPAELKKIQGSAFPKKRKARTQRCPKKGLRHAAKSSEVAAQARPR